MTTLRQKIAAVPELRHILASTPDLTPILRQHPLWAGARKEEPNGSLKVSQLYTMGPRDLQFLGIEEISPQEFKALLHKAISRQVDTVVKEVARLTQTKYRSDGFEVARTQRAGVPSFLVTLTLLPV